MAAPVGLNTVTLKPDDLVSGRTVKWEMGGHADFSSGGKFFIALYGGDGTVGTGTLIYEDQSVPLFLATSKIGWSATFYLHTLTTGGSGAHRLWGEIHFRDSQSTTFDTWCLFSDTDILLDTTASHTLNWYWKFDTTGNSITVNGTLIGLRA